MKRTDDRCNKCDDKHCNGNAVRDLKGNLKYFTKCSKWRPIVSKFKLMDCVNRVTAGYFPTSATTAKLFHKYM